MNVNEISKAVAILRAGGLVAMPTETVYGLAADAQNPTALRRIFLAKQRPLNHPLIVHLADVAQLSEWAREVSDATLLLAQAFWPGPLTLILKKTLSANDLVTGGQDTVGLRIPHHPIALALLQQYGGGLAAPSANRFGKISPTTAEAVQEELGAAVELILDGGQCDVGVESTIVDMTQHRPVILRPGMISAAQIEKVLQQKIMAKKQGMPRVSGSHESHYAPNTKMRLMSIDEFNAYRQNLRSDELPRAVLMMEEKIKPMAAETIVRMPLTPEAYAYQLYRILRELDKKNLQQIIVVAVPENASWDAVRDRLKRAAS